jgi:hypothetical protein
MHWSKRRLRWIVAAPLALLFPLGVLAASLPTGEHAVGNTVIEPAYDDITGNIVYLHTPDDREGSLPPRRFPG